MNITGSTINYYFHCKRQCWLSYHDISMEFNSDLVSVGSELHKDYHKDSDRRDVWIDNICVDQLTDEYAIEYKKSSSDLTAAKWQLLYYLYILRSKGIYKKGRLEIIEHDSNEREYYIVELDDTSISELETLLCEIKEFLNMPSPPQVNRKCSGACSYYEYCNI